MDKLNRKLIMNILVGFVILGCVLFFYNTFSMDNTYKFDSVVYDIDKAYIKGISSNTSVSLFIKYFDYENCSIEVADKDGNKIIDGYVFNGSKTLVYDNNKNVVATYTNTITGDYTEDGIIDNKDFYDMGKCLVNNCSMDEYLKLGVDIDNDSNFKINDLVLLDKAVTLGYTSINLDKEDMILQTNEIGRIVSSVEPSYGINFNVLWTSSDEEVAAVNEAGVVTGKKEGNAIIKATTLDGKYFDTVNVKVDNTIQLDSYEGMAYAGGKEKIVKIKAVSYEDISCLVSNEEVLSCEIVDKTLVMKPMSAGNVEVTVNSSKYGSVVYKMNVESVYLNVMPKYFCMFANKSTLLTVSGFKTGELTFEIDKKDFIKDAYMTTYNGKNMLKVDAGSKQGRAILRVKESNGNNYNDIVIDVTSLRLSDIGKFTSVGKEVNVTAIGDNLGNLTCVSNNPEVGTCRVEGKDIFVTPLKRGEVTVDVYNNFEYEGEKDTCGQDQFIVVVQE